jgi:cyclophilin family peptidyl-prolyl cis-trans isomerase
MSKKLVGILLCSWSCLIYAASVSSNCARPVVELTTNYGVIDVKLNRNKAPLTVANFEQYVNSGFYNNKIFHRVIAGFMIQGGGFDQNLTQAPTRAPIKNEAANGLKNTKYSIAMARTSDPDSATAQFFINVNDNAFLNYATDNSGYAVFGEVSKGQAVVDKIASVATHNQDSFENVPVAPVIIKRAQIVACSK